MAIDLDGTLLDSSREIPDRHRRALERAVRAGITVVFASGRVAKTMRPYARSLGLEPPMVCCNGAHVLAADGTEIRHEHLHPQAVRAALRVARSSDLQLNLYSRETLYFGHETAMRDLYLERVRVLTPEPLPSGSFDRVPITKLLFVGEPEELEPIHLDPDGFGPFPGASMVRSEREYLELLPADANKGRGLATLAEALRVSANQVAAAGDYWNDVEMLQWAGFSGAMASAPDGVKAVADVVVPTSQEGGLADFVEKILR
ncbi:MAG: Cof-type HAD-IIB family hydrolase [Fimbriimonadaceae bacterium]